MPDSYTLQLENFRSIRDASVEIAPLTVVYGPNGSGKSSLIYGLLTLRNFLTNPNQIVPGLFSYPTISLGGYEEVVSGHDADKLISLTLAAGTSAGKAAYSLAIGESMGQSTIEVDTLGVEHGSMPLEIPFPYPANQEAALDIALGSDDGTPDTTLTWNGVVVGENRHDPVNREQVVRFLTFANSPMELARNMGFVPIRRGFATPTYSVTSITPALATDLEVASLLANERYLQYEVSDYVEEVAQRRMAVTVRVGTSTFTIDSIPRNGGVPVSMVNDGFGVNQLAYMLTISLYSKFRVVAIEEPEIHLHPSMVRKLAHTFAAIARERDKRFVISTHSEVFVVALLAQIAAGKIGVDDVSFILAENEAGDSRFVEQEAKPNGQIKGGLDSFVASGFEDIAVFLGMAPEQTPAAR